MGEANPPIETSTGFAPLMIVVVRFPDEMAGINAPDMTILAGVASLEVFALRLAMCQSADHPMRKRLNAFMLNGAVAVVILGEWPDEAVFAMMSDVLFEER